MIRNWALGFKKLKKFGCLALLALGLALSLTGCGNKVMITTDSPQPVSHTVAVTSQGTEKSQKVQIRFEFDKPVTIAAQAKNDFKLLLNGKALDGETMTYEVEADKADPKALLLNLVPQPEVASPGAGKYFALYEGNLTIQAVDPQGLAAVTAQGGKACAKWQNTTCLIPSGLALRTVSQVRGDAKTGRKAQTVVAITALPQVRVMSWLQFLSNGSPVMAKGYKTETYTYTNEGSFPLHDHQFLIMNREDYTQDLVSQLKLFFGAQNAYSFSQQGGQVTIAAQKAVEGQVLQLKVYGSN